MSRKASSFDQPAGSFGERVLCSTLIKHAGYHIQVFYKYALNKFAISGEGAEHVKTEGFHLVNWEAENTNFWGHRAMLLLKIQ